MFREELERKINNSLKSSINYAITVLGDSGVVIEGHMGVSSYSDTRLRVKTRKSYISIIGTGLTIDDINDKDIFVTGHIEEVLLDDRC